MSILPSKTSRKSSKSAEETQALTSRSTSVKTASGGTLSESVSPTLARRSLNRKSTIKSGRVIGEGREKLETASERLEARRKIHRQQASRVIVSVLGIVLLSAGLFAIGSFFIQGGESLPTSTSVTIPYTPTIPIEDQDTGTTSQLTGRMKEYIGMVEADLRELGLTPVRAVIPSGAIREVDFYLNGYTGFIKTTIDRGAGVTAEDTERMLRYLANQGITDFEYIDVRLDRLAYWK